METGNAVENVFFEDYVFKATQRNALVKDSKIMVTEKDKPGNMTVKDFKLEQ